jgi:hypothetical protein
MVINHLLLIIIIVIITIIIKTIEIMYKYY